MSLSAGVTLCLLALFLGVLLGYRLGKPARVLPAEASVEPIPPPTLRGRFWLDAERLSEQMFVAAGVVPTTEQALPVTMALADTMAESYGLGVSEFREALVLSSPLPPPVTDSLATHALETMSGAHRRKA